MQRLLALGALALTLVAWPASAQTPRIVPTGAEARAAGFRIDRIARVPCDSRACLTQMAFAPSGTLYVNDRRGRVLVVEGGRLREEPYATVQTRTSGEAGLLGLALDPRFDEEPWVYVFYTLPDGSHDVVVRIRGREREELLRMPSGAPWHHGGVLAFGPDGHLYVANGEAHRQERAQDPDALGGKIYRIARDGSIPEDNPFAGSRTWSYGHRNPFGLAFDPETDLLWESENGPRANDEVNLIEPGENYGWPRVSGAGGGGRYTDPVRDYERIVVPTMMAFAGDAFPEPYRGDLFLGTYGGGGLRRLVLDEQRRAVAREEMFVDARIVGVAWGPDGLYFTTDDAIWRVRAAAAPSPTTTPTASARPTATPPPADDDGANVGLLVGLALGIAVIVAVAAVALGRRRR